METKVAGNVLLTTDSVDLFFAELHLELTVPIDFDETKEYPLLLMLYVYSNAFSF